MNSYEVVVVGAGWGGLVAAKTYLQTKPGTELLVIDNASTLGGTWCKERLYPHLIAEAHIGYYEFSDLEMCQDGQNGQNVTPSGQVTGEAVHEYLSSYATKSGLHERLRLGTKVVRASRVDKLWHLELAKSGSDSKGAANGTGKETGAEKTETETETVTCVKLIVATGFTSQPFIPDIASHGFTGHVMHSKELGKPETAEKLNDPSIRTVAVYGGSKSSFDAVNMLIKSGKRVEWIIRGRKGVGGPSIMSPLVVLGKPGVPGHYTRLLAAMSPNVFNIETDGLARWIHGSGGLLGWLTRLLVKAYWRGATWLLTRDAQYDRSENGRLLRPSLGLDSFFWSPATLGVMTHPELWEHIHCGTMIKVRENSIQHLDARGILLDDGSRVEADALVFATGWKALPDDFFFSPTDRLKYGLSSPASFDTREQKRWQSLRLEMDTKVQQSLPILRESPGWHDHHPRVEDDFHLYRSIIPASPGEHERCLAYVGFLRQPHSTVVYEAQTLWAAAYLQGKLDIPPAAEREQNTALVNAWIRRRYLYGRRIPYALNEFLPYVDMLYSDLGVNSRRKSTAISELLDPYKPSDFKGVVDEWMASSHHRLQHTRKV